jgi:large subunit ribosomal protein L23
MHWREIIRRPVITEKSSLMANELNQYTFVVHDRANKLQIKEAVELAWPDVEVEKVPCRICRPSAPGVGGG